MLTIVKHFHILFAVLTAFGFVVRGVWRLRGSPNLQRRWVRTLPHINDTLLFATGLTMLLLYRWWPFDQPWLSVKLFAVLLYILLGGLALRGPSPHARLGAWVLALLALAYIFWLALNKYPLPAALL